MASDNEASCESDPNFAVICAFLEKFGGTCGLTNIDFLDLQEMLENTQEVSQELIELHVKLLRKARKSVFSERWERAIIKLCHGFCIQDAWEIERFGYKKARIGSKLRILKELLEMQFDFNAKFKNDINKMSAEELRTQPLGRDQMGHIYWFQTDESCQIRVYKEDPDEETWSLVAKDREGLVTLISQLTSSDSMKAGSDSVTNEDSNSLAEKPIIDTGQTDSNLSLPSKKSNDEEIYDSEETRQPEIEAIDYKIDVEIKSGSILEQDSQLKFDNNRELNKESVSNSDKQKLEVKAEFSDEINKIKMKPQVENILEPESKHLNISKSFDINPVDSVLNLSNKPVNNEDENTLDLSINRNENNAGIDLSIKTPTKLKSVSDYISSTDAKLELIGVKDKYIRNEVSDINSRISLNVPTYASPIFHRKAIHSAGFDERDVQNNLKRPYEEEEEEEIEEPSDIKRMRLSRPTLLGNKRPKPYNDNEDDDVEEPIKESNIVGEAIEEPVLYVYGQGSGRECETGNEKRSTDDNNSVSEQKDSSNTPDQIPSSSDIVNSINKCNLGSTSRDEVNLITSSSPLKKQYKLGTIIDVKTDKYNNERKSPIKNSRWDKGKPETEDFKVPEVKHLSGKSRVQYMVNKWEQISTKSSTHNEDVNKSEDNFFQNKPVDKSESSTPKKMMFFFGPKSRNFTSGLDLPLTTLGFCQKPTETKVECTETKKPDVIKNKDAEEKEQENVESNKNVSTAEPYELSMKVPKYEKNDNIKLANKELTPSSEISLEKSENVPVCEEDAKSEKSALNEQDSLDTNKTVDVSETSVECETNSDNMIGEQKSNILDSPNGIDMDAMSPTSSNDEIIATSDKEEGNTKLEDFQEITKGMTSEIASQFQTDSEHSNEEDNNTTNTDSAFDINYPILTENTHMYDYSSLENNSKCENENNKVGECIEPLELDKNANNKVNDVPLSNDNNVVDIKSGVTDACRTELSLKCDMTPEVASNTSAKSLICNETKETLSSIDKIDDIEEPCVKQVLLTEHDCSIAHHSKKEEKGELPVSVEEPCIKKVIVTEHDCTQHLGKKHGEILSNAVEKKNIQPEELIATTLQDLELDAIGTNECQNKFSKLTVKETPIPGVDNSESDSMKTPEISKIVQNYKELVETPDRTYCEVLHEGEKSQVQPKPFLDVPQVDITKSEIDNSSLSSSEEKFKSSRQTDEISEPLKKNNEINETVCAIRSTCSNELNEDVSVPKISVEKLSSLKQSVNISNDEESVKKTEIINKTSILENKNECVEKTKKDIGESSTSHVVTESAPKSITIEKTSKIVDYELSPASTSSFCDEDVEQVKEQTEMSLTLTENLNNTETKISSQYLCQTSEVPNEEKVALEDLEQKIEPNVSTTQPDIQDEDVSYNSDVEKTIEDVDKTQDGISIEKSESDLSETIDADVELNDTTEGTYNSEKIIGDSSSIEKVTSPEVAELETVQTVKSCEVECQKKVINVTEHEQKVLTVASGSVKDSKLNSSCDQTKVGYSEIKNTIKTDNFEVTPSLEDKFDALEETLARLHGENKSDVSQENKTVLEKNVDNLEKESELQSVFELETKYYENAMQPEVIEKYTVENKSEKEEGSVTEETLQKKDHLEFNQASVIEKSDDNHDCHEDHTALSSEDYNLQINEDLEKENKPESKNLVNSEEDFKKCVPVESVHQISETIIDTVTVNKTSCDSEIIIHSEKRNFEVDKSSEIVEVLSETVSEKNIEQLTIGKEQSEIHKIQNEEAPQKIEDETFQKDKIKSSDVIIEDVSTKQEIEKEIIKKDSFQENVVDSSTVLENNEESPKVTSSECTNDLLKQKLQLEEVLSEEKDNLQQESDVCVEVKDKTSSEQSLCETSAVLTEINCQKESSEIKNLEDPESKTDNLQEHTVLEKIDDLQIVESDVSDLANEVPEIITIDAQKNDANEKVICLEEKSGENASNELSNKNVENIISETIKSEKMCSESQKSLSDEIVENISEKKETDDSGAETVDVPVINTEKNVEIVKTVLAKNSADLSSQEIKKDNHETVDESITNKENTSECVGKNEDFTEKIPDMKESSSINESKDSKVVPEMLEDTTSNEQNLSNLEELQNNQKSDVGKETSKNLNDSNLEKLQNSHKSGVTAEASVKDMNILNLEELHDNQKSDVDNEISKNLNDSNLEELQNSQKSGVTAEASVKDVNLSNLEELHDNQKSDVGNETSKNLNDSNLEELQNSQKSGVTAEASVTDVNLSNLEELHDNQKSDLNTEVSTKTLNDSNLEELQENQKSSVNAEACAKNVNESNVDDAKKHLSEDNLLKPEEDNNISVNKEKTIKLVSVDKLQKTTKETEVMQNLEESDDDDDDYNDSDIMPLQIEDVRTLESDDLDAEDATVSQQLDIDKCKENILKLKDVKITKTNKYSTKQIGSKKSEGVIEIESEDEDGTGKNLPEQLDQVEDEKVKLETRIKCKSLEELKDPLQADVSDQQKILDSRQTLDNLSKIKDLTVQSVSKTVDENDLLERVEDIIEIESDEESKAMVRTIGGFHIPKNLGIEVRITKTGTQKQSSTLKRSDVKSKHSVIEIDSDDSNAEKGIEKDPLAIETDLIPKLLQGNREVIVKKVMPPSVTLTKQLATTARAGVIEIESDDELPRRGRKRIDYSERRITRNYKNNNELLPKKIAEKPKHAISLEEIDRNQILNRVPNIPTPTGKFKDFSNVKQKETQNDNQQQKSLVIEARSLRSKGKSTVNQISEVKSLHHLKTVIEEMKRKEKNVEDCDNIISEVNEIPENKVKKPKLTKGRASTETPDGEELFQNVRQLRSKRISIPADDNKNKKKDESLQENLDATTAETKKPKVPRGRKSISKSNEELKTDEEESEKKTKGRKSIDKSDEVESKTDDPKVGKVLRNKKVSEGVDLNKKTKIKGKHIDDSSNLENQLEECNKDEENEDKLKVIKNKKGKKGDVEAESVENEIGKAKRRTKSIEESKIENDEISKDEEPTKIMKLQKNKKIAKSPRSSTEIKTKDEEQQKKRRSSKVKEPEESAVVKENVENKTEEESNKKSKGKKGVTNLEATNQDELLIDTELSIKKTKIVKNKKGVKTSKRITRNRKKIAEEEKNESEEKSTNKDLYHEKKQKGQPTSEHQIQPTESENDDVLSVTSPPSAASADFGEEIGSSSSDDVIAVNETDPLACSEDEIETILEPSKQPPLTLATFKIDLSDSPTPPVTVLGSKRKRVRDSIENDGDVEESLEKRPKIRGKRTVDVDLRRSIEEQKLLNVSSSDDDNSQDAVPPDLGSGEEVKIKPVVLRNGRKPKKRMPHLRKATDSPAPSSDALSETSRTESTNTPPITQKSATPRKKKRTLLGLDIPYEATDFNSPVTGVRQSRRIAQLKIKEEAERRKLEELALAEMKEEKKTHKHKKHKKNEDKDYKAEKRKRNKNVPTDEETTADGDSEEKKKRKRKKRKHKDPRKIFDESNPWRSSSGSSSSNEEEEDDEIVEYSEDDVPLFKSDHEFSPESDLEENGEVQPMKRARTARKESDVEEVDDYACQKCSQSDHPEWILLCDGCDNGWHCSCLRPALLVIPEGDWFCPPCQHASLINNLQKTLTEYDKRVTRRDLEERRKERLAYVGISLNNVLPSKETIEHIKHKTKHEDDEEVEDAEDEDSDSDSESESETESSSGSESEPVYQLRERRQAHSYRFNDYDELINSAIQDEMEAVKGAGNQGRGKDISTIVNAEKEEEAQRLLKAEAEAAQAQVEDIVPQVEMPTEQEILPEIEPLPPVVPTNTDAQPLADKTEDSDDEPIRPIKKKHFGRKKHRKLNSLDISSGDDPDSDEDFKGSSSSNEDEEDLDEEDLASESSDLDSRRGKRRKDSGPIRRSTRARTSRYDRDFINDDTDDDDAPRRKRTKALWDDEDSESEESDRSWGRRKKKAARRPRRKSVSSTVKKRKSKKKKTPEDSDPEVFKHSRKPKIKYGGLNDDDEETGRRTRGKKINYVEALGSDSDEDTVKRPVPKLKDSEEEYVVNEEELENEKGSDGEDLDTNIEGYPPPMSIIPTVVPTMPPIVHPQMHYNIHQQPPPNAYPMKPLVGPLSLISPQESALLEEFGSQDTEEEPNPIDVINKNMEEMNESEMEKMMEEEEYATKQLQLVALQIEKEKKRKEREAKKLELLAQQEQKVPKKRGRKPKALTQDLTAVSSLMMSSELHNNAELSEPPGVSLPLFGELPPDLGSEEIPKKRRGRGKGKKTIAAEQAAAAAAAAACREKLLSTDPKLLSSALDSTHSSGSNTASPAPDSPMHSGKLGIAAPPQPFSQSQPTPSVITRMLQSQPASNNFPVGGTANLGAKYFASPPPGSTGTDAQPTNTISNLPPTSAAGIPLAPNQFIPGSQRGQIPSPYRQTPPGIGHYPVVRGGPPPPIQMRSPGPQGILPHMYHPHRTIDPSPSGGGPVNIPGRSSPPMVSPSAGSPLNTKGDPTPPPPPYPRPQMVRFPNVSHTPPISIGGPVGPPGPQPQRHLSMIPSHLQQARPSNVPPYHPNLPPNYHYGSYPPPPPPIGSGEDALPPTVYQGSPYGEQFSGDGQPLTTSENSNSKSFDEETGGEFGGLVSYFSSQREDDLDT